MFRGTELFVKLSCRPYLPTSLPAHRKDCTLSKTRRAGGGHGKSGGYPLLETV